MAYSLQYFKCTKNYCNRTFCIHVIITDVVTCFFVRQSVCMVCGLVICYLWLQYYLYLDGRGSFDFKPITGETVEFGS